jgi:FkbM family methyltransferase
MLLRIFNIIKNYLKEVSRALMVNISFAIYISIRRSMEIMRLTNITIMHKIRFPINFMGRTILLPITGVLDLDSFWDIIRDRMAGIPVSTYKVIIDCGANIGISSFIYGAIVSRNGGKVLAVEPNPLIIPQLYNNLFKAGLLNTVKIIPVAVADYAGYSTLHIAEAHICSSLKPDYASKHGYKVSKKICVRVLTLQKLLELEKFANDASIDLLLLDVEGVAYNILQASRELLNNCRIKSIKVDLADYKMKTMLKT